MLCRLLLLFPVAGLVLFALLPLPTALALYLPVTALSLAFAVPSMRAMYRPATMGAEAMRGREGMVVTIDGRSGMLRYECELWTYSASEPLAPGDRIRIGEIDGLTAVVRPVAGSRRPIREGATR